MKDMFTIVFRLTVSCLLAGLVMGATLVFTNKAKLHNAEVREHRVMLGLLGYGAATPAPASLQLHPVYRYLVTAGGESSIGYLLPASGEGESGSVFVNLGLDGNFLGKEPVRLDTHKAGGLSERDAAITAALGSSKEVRYVDQTIVVTDGGVRKAYLLPGEFPGFKTFINLIVAVDPAFTVTGLEIMEHEEDPGLGGEIVQGYFKNQFRGKTYETLKKLGVAKEPLPKEYRRVLENDKNGGVLGAAEVAQIEAIYGAKDIYALTGATISSQSVTAGVKSIVNKFAYRIGILDRVLREQQIVVPF